MNDVLMVFLSLSLSGSLMILILLACKHFWKDKLSRQWQYYVWLIVIARLLLPFAPEVNLMGNIFQTAFHTVSQADTASLQQEQATFIQTGSSQPSQDTITLILNIIGLIWLVITFVLLIRKITIYQSFVRYVKAGQILVSDVERLDRLSLLAEQAGVKKTVELCVNPLISSPLLIGFFRPCIVLPDTDISENAFRYIALHELTHYRRRDMFCKWLVLATVCLHWFNPLVYIMSREINKACEFSCDEAIIAKLDHSSIKEYGKTLLDSMMKAGNYKESIASVTLNEDKEMLKERLGAIMSFKKKSKLRTAYSTVLTVILLCAATFTGAYAAVPGDAPQEGYAETPDASNDSDTVVINLSSSHGQKSLIHSSSFEAGDGQVLTLEIESSITGTVDLFLFSPSHQEQRITIGGNNDTKTINLSEGTWAYNCTGFFDSGDITIIGTVK